jgi:hypothetical protein
VRSHADGILALMAFTVLPEVTTSSLSIDNPDSDDPNLSQQTLGGGFTYSDRFPLYLEGMVGWSRYNPRFLASDEDGPQRIPATWKGLSGTGGIGWDFPLIPNRELKIRPILNVTLGHLKSDSRATGSTGAQADDGTPEIEFLQRGAMNAYGLGGSLMLDYQRYREPYELDLELRYTHINLTSFNESTQSVHGSSDAKSLGFWARWRAPTGAVLLQRPLRYVLELSNTIFFGPQRDTLGSGWLSSAGIGLELDSSAHRVLVTRTRLLYRYLFGEHISGHSIGFAVSF